MKKLRPGMLVSCSPSFTMSTCYLWRSIATGDNDDNGELAPDDVALVVSACKDGNMNQVYFVVSSSGDVGWVYADFIEGVNLVER